MNIITNEYGPSSRKCPTDERSEMKDRYIAPHIKTPTITRQRRMEQFMWQELCAEYMRHNDALHQAKIPEYQTEYYDEYCNNTPKENLVAKEERISRYPLYSTRAVTIYNQNGDINRDFKKRYTVTRPVGLQRQQFG